VDALPNVDAASYRLEADGIQLEARNRSSGDAQLEGILPGRRGYAVVSGRDLSLRGGEALVERGLAREWDLHTGDVVSVSGFGAPAPLTVVGIVVEPETVAFPLVNRPRVYAAYDDVRRVAGTGGSSVNTALLWAADPRHLDVMLAQARAAAFGVRDLTFVTRAGIRVLVRRAGGLVIALLGAFSLVALAAAGLMLVSSARAELQRRLEAIGLFRALGASPRAVASAYGVEAALVAAPAAAAGVALGAVLVHGPTTRLLVALNQLAPGATLVALLAGAVVVITALVSASAALPAWRAASRPPVDNLRRSDVRRVPLRLPLPAGAVGLGMRLSAARPTRTLATSAVVAASVSVILLLLAIASLLQRLDHDPQAIGKRYQLTVAAAPSATRRVERVPGVAAAAVRYEAEAADSFDLGESFLLVGFDRDHTPFEAPELVAGRRLRHPGEAEVGLGLADALSLHPGAMLAAQLTSGRELRARVVGVVRALEREGRIAYVSGEQLRRADPYAYSTVAVKLDDDADASAVSDELSRVGLPATSAAGVGEAVQGWATRNSAFVRLLVALLVTVAALDALVCVYALVQALVLTAQERRRTLSVVRAVGASRRQLAAIFGGSVLVVLALAVPLGVVAEAAGLGPLVAHLAAAYATLRLAAGDSAVAVLLAGLLLAALVGAVWVARRAASEPIVLGLREE
jgi:ABC-type lipoprotein release transport system permease subunit